MVKLRVVNLSPDTASLSVSLDQLPDGGVISIAEGVAYGEASAYVGFGPSAQDVLAGTWSFVDDDIGEVDSVFVDFANVARSSAERPVTGTCNTIVFAADDTFEQGVRPFLIAENPQLCSHWRNSSDGVQPSFWPSCD